MPLNAHGEERTYSPAYTDTDKITFGKFKGELLQDVPASYLAWLWYNDTGDSLCNYAGNDSTGDRFYKRLLANYIWNSRGALNQELPKDKQIKKGYK